MFAIDQPYAITLIASVIISAGLAVAALMHKRSIGVYAFTLLNASIGMWAFASIFEVSSKHLQIKIFAYSFKYLFIVLVPIAWYAFGVYYANRLRRLNLPDIAKLMIIPVITIFLVATNQYHDLMFTSLDVLEIESNIYIIRNFGPWFWIHASYSYTLLFLGFFYMSKHLIGSPPLYRWQLATITIGGLAPCLANIAHIFALLPYPHLDPTPFAFTISGLTFMIGIVRFQLLDIVPIALDEVIENLDDGIIVVDDELRVLNLNPAAKRFADTPLSQHIGVKAEEVFSWWAELDLDNDSPCYPDSDIVELFIENRHHMLRPKKTKLFCSDRQTGLLITLHDVTDAITAREALHCSEEQFRSLSENAPVIIFTLEPDGLTSYLNPAFEKILGSDRQKIMGQPFIDLLNDDDKDRCLQIFNQLVEKKKSATELNITFSCKSGANRLFNTSVAANIDHRGEVTGIIGLAKDITEEHDLQNQLFQSQKMEAIGTLAGGIAHDFNNLLMGIQANLSLMHLDDSADQDLHDKINRIEAQILSGANLTRQLLGYARKGKYVTTTVNLENLVKETLTVVQRTNKAIIIQSLLADAPIYIKADRGQIEMMLLNLFVNAMDAMPHGGKLTVSARHVGHTGLRYASDTDTSYCELLVVDTGTGIDPVTQKRIFEPFFTTKEVGRGTGLGLASVYGVVQNHDGFIDVDSTEGEGTTFTLYLPTTQKPLEKAPARKQCAIGDGGGTILLVDDEPLILKYSLEMISSLNFKVLTANNGETAIEIYKENQPDIDLVILDMIMPGMDGYMVYKALNRMNPMIRVIVTSGYATDSRIEGILSEGCHACLKKPYTREELSYKIKNILRSSNNSHDHVSNDKPMVV